MGSNALNALLGKAFSERSEDFFDSLGTEAAASVPFLQKVSMGCHNF